MTPERGPFARAVRRVTRSLTGDDAVDRCSDCRDPVLPGANRCDSCLND